ncbi:hypothetical protein BDA99DRAFT_185602 [Phascolomyces articulosus]|uniref:Uncharacterized protein n=1 Tax=Phascolomyces articulosus TaxID=60185 RepID=A0AAD5K363_9FUNG|nr:hypothetical protein BDA99DRAFT_185602 [Phascolomyces articulosus]
MENALKASTSLEQALTALQKYHTKHSNRRAVPRIYTDIQNTLIKENPNLEGVNRSWFGDQVKNCPNYNQPNEFKDLGNQLIEEVRGFLESCSWENVVLSHLDNVASGSKDSSKDANKYVDEEDIDDDDDVSDDDDDDDDDSNRPKKIQETITFSLRSILRSELDYDEILFSFQKEQERVGKCLSELGKGVDLLTNKIITGDIATLFGETITSSQVDLQGLAPEFDFGSNTKTTVAVSPIPSNTTQQKMIYDGIYTFGHFSNILSGCIGNSVREKSDRPAYKDIRNMINRSNTVSAQEDMSFTGGINNALREFNTACKNLWTRKRHDRDLRVLTTALFRINLAPDRTKRYMQRLANFAKEKQAVGMEKETTESGDTSLSSIPYIKRRLNLFLLDLMWSIAREREEGVTDMLI